MSKTYRVVKASEATSDDYASDYIPIQQVGPDVEGVDDVPVLWLIPDTTTQAIAAVPKCEHGNIDGHYEIEDSELAIKWILKDDESGYEPAWCEGAPELRALLDALIEDG